MSFQPPGSLEVAESVSVAQAPWGLERLSNSRLPATFVTSGTRSFQPPKYTVDRRGSSYFSSPGILGTGGTQSFQATWSFRPQEPFGLAERS